MSFHFNSAHLFLFLFLFRKTENKNRASLRSYNRPARCHRRGSIAIDFSPRGFAGDRSLFDTDDPTAISSSSRREHVLKEELILTRNSGGLDFCPTISCSRRPHAFHHLPSNYFFLFGELFSDKGPSRRVDWSNEVLLCSLAPERSGPNMRTM